MTSFFLRAETARAALAAALAALLPVAAAAQPKTVIPWLSGAPQTQGAPPIQLYVPPVDPAAQLPLSAEPGPSFSLPAEPAARIVISPNAPPAPVGGASDPITIESSVISPIDLAPRAKAPDILSLEAPSAEGAGLAGAQDLGIKADMWRGSSPASARDALSGLAPTPYQSANALLKRFLIASAPPPPGAEGVVALRARALLDLGAPDEAARLVQLARASKDKAAERVGAEAALISGRDDAYCSIAHKTVEEAAKAEDLDGFWMGMRAYCLAREGAPLAPVAAAALRERGKLDPLTAQWIEAMTDKAIAPLIDKPKPNELSPLRLAALRQLKIAPPGAGARMAPLSLLPAFLKAAEANAESKIVAAERLEAAGALQTTELVEVYEGEGPKGKGAGFARAQIVLAASGKTDAGAVADAFIAAAKEAGPQGFASMARAVAPFLASTFPRRIAPPERMFAVRDGLLMAGDADAARRWTGLLPLADEASKADAKALALLADSNARDSLTGTERTALDKRARGGDASAALLMAGLAGLDLGVRIDSPAPWLALAQQGRVAEAALGALKALGADGERTRPPTLANAVRTLKLAGLESDARRIATEAALMARWP